MSKCYYQNLILLKEGILDNLIDAVYVILLKNSNRTNNVLKQIYNYKLSKNNHIVVNNGYKCLEKNLCKPESNFDLLHANIYCMNDANKNNYNNILILEDDFEFDHQIRDKKILKDIEIFFKNNQFNIYSLGSINIFFIPKINNLKHNKSFIGGSAHSLIFSREARYIIIKEYNKNKCLDNVPYFKGHDIWFNTILDKKFFYYKPLCYQKFPNTENSTKWQTNFIRLFLNLLKLDKKVQPGWTILYLLLYILHLLTLIVIILTLSKFFFLIKKNNKS